MTLGREISDVGNLKSSISQTLKMLAPPPEKLPVRQPPAAPRPAAVRPAEKPAALQPAAGPPTRRGRVEQLEDRIVGLEGELKEERKLTEKLRLRIRELEATGEARAG